MFPRADMFFISPNATCFEYTDTCKTFPHVAKALWSEFEELARDLGIKPVKFMPEEGTPLAKVADEEGWMDFLSFYNSFSFVPDDQYRTLYRVDLEESEVEVWSDELGKFVKAVK